MKVFFLLLSLVFISNLAAQPQMQATATSSIPPYQAQDYSHLLGMPGFTDNLLKMHFQLYQGYVKNVNSLLDELKKYSDQGMANSYTYGALKRRLGWEFDGMRLHELYFGNLGGKGSPSPSSSIYKAIVAQYKDFDSWQKDFVATGAMRGVGWAILYYDPIHDRLFNAWINEHDTGHLAGGNPLLVMDVWEHAFITQFGLDRAKYIQAFMSNIDWDVVNERWMQVGQSP